MSKPEYSSSRPSTSGTTTGEKPPNPKVSRTPESVRAVWDFIRPQPWVINNIRQRKSQMLLFRSWLAACAVLILLLGTHSLTTIGNLCVRHTFSVRAHCADAVNTSVVLISGCFSLCLSLLVIRFKCTYSYVPSLRILQPLFNSLAGLQVVVQSLMGLLVGWGIGSAGMKAALAVRSQLIVESTLEKAANRSVGSHIASSSFSI